VLVQTSQLVRVIGAPGLVLDKAAHPAALAKDHVVHSVGRLKRTSHVDALGVAHIGLAGRVTLAAAKRVVRGRNAVLEQAVHLVNLTSRDENGVLHDAPVVGVGAVQGAGRKLSVARRNRLRSIEFRKSDNVSFDSPGQRLHHASHQLTHCNGSSIPS
jgi:hypothetical protein